MKTYHWNHEENRWYMRDWNLFHHLRHWFVWVGGWEKANGAGWNFFYRGANGKRRLLSPTPISLFGHRITFYGWGWQIRVGKRWLVASKAGHPLQVYLSPDGTPSGATSWWYGTPHEITRKCT